MALLRAAWRDAFLVLLVAACLAMFGLCFVAGGSMRPAFEPGDLVLYRRGGEGVARGSVVVLSAGSGCYIHRVTDVSAAGRLTTRGDANPIPDREPVEVDGVRGRVVARVPSGRLLRRLAAWGGSVRLWSQSHTQR